MPEPLIWGGAVTLDHDDLSAVLNSRICGDDAREGRPNNDNVSIVSTQSSMAMSGGVPSHEGGSVLFSASTAATASSSTSTVPHDGTLVSSAKAAVPIIPADATLPAARTLP